jgi:hypothetical protein
MKRTIKANEYAKSISKIVVILIVTTIILSGIILSNAKEADRIELKDGNVVISESTGKIDSLERVSVNLGKAKELDIQMFPEDEDLTTYTYMLEDSQGKIEVLPKLQQKKLVVTLKERQSRKCYNFIKKK